MKTIVLTGGGTAGHVVPNIALLPFLKERFNNIIYIGSGAEIEKKLLGSFPYVKYYSITTAKFKRSLSLENLKIPYKLFKGKKEATKILKELKPDVIFSKGGFVALPVVLAAKKLKIPVIAHESDLTLGLANRIVKNKINKICTTFKETANKLKNGVYVGPIIKEEITKGNAQKAKQELKLSSKPVLLIIGGSQGAKEINLLVENNLKSLTKTHQIIHLRGKGKLNKNINFKDYYQLEFHNNMQDLYACANLCITRGGSNTIFELLANNIPMLIIPLRKHTRGDQVANAKYFENKNFAVSLTKKEPKDEDFLAAWNLLKRREKIIRLTNKPQCNGTLKTIKEIEKMTN